MATAEFGCGAISHIDDIAATRRPIGIYNFAIRCRSYFDEKL
ncbi:MAG TPA: hypothetical protein VHW73_12590 [Rudaea sp.]|nr:hypothetical protein [Rudaea sp.]